jgi:hypothetical protein
MRSLRITVSLACVATICWGAGYAYGRWKSHNTDTESDEYVEIHLDPVVMKDAARLVAGVQHELRHIEAHRETR